MKKIFILSVLVLLLANPIKAEPNQMNKLDSQLQMLVRLDSLSQSRLPPAMVSHREGSVAALIKVSRAPDELETVGVNVRSVVGNIVTADIPVSALLDVAQMENVIYVEAAQRMKPYRSALNVSVPNINVDQIWNSNPSYTGKDVIVGIIDTGIDWQHSAFSKPDGSTRILAIWDQLIDTPGQVPDEFDYGTEWTKEQIDAGVCSQVDISGHGTHVASTAAGNPKKDGKYIGVAPDADIIVVKYTFSSDAAVDAAKYIFDKAEQLGKPAVLNMSFGNHYGPHDGRGLEQEALNFLVRETPGRTIVAAAGNDGGIPVHIGKIVSAKRTNPQWTRFQSGINSLYTYIQIWYDRSDSLDVRLLVYDNDNQIWNSDWISAGKSIFDFVPNAEISVNSMKPHPEFSDLGLVEVDVMSLEDFVMPLDRYTFEIQFSGDGVDIDAYCIDGADGYFLSIEDSMYLMPDAEKTVNSPASAKEIIAVASYSTKRKWLDESGTLRKYGDNVGGISIFSSHGPLRNGGQKPDIAAPGEWITAARSEWSYFPKRLVNYDENYVVLPGTSMASPHVTGVSALIYEQNPNLSAFEIKKILRTTAIDRGVTGWDRLWGAGQINPLETLNIPAKPKNLNAAHQTDGVNLTWSSNRETNLAGYKLVVRHADSLPNDEKIIDVGNLVEYRLIGPNLPANDFAASVIAYNTDGNESCPSEPIVVRFDNSIQPPTGIIALEGDGVVELRWNKSPEYQVTGYKIYVGNSPGRYSEQIKIGKVNRYLLKDRTNNVPIYIALTAYDASGNESDKSQELKVVPHLKQIDRAITVLSGWPKYLPDSIFSSPAVTDLDDDGRGEIIIGCNDENLYAWHHDSSVVAGFPVSMNGPVTGTPAIGDIDRDDQLEIVVAAGRSVTVLNSDGTVADGWMKRTNSDIRGAPILVDIDSDFNLEIIAVTVNSSVYAWHHNGKLVDGWPVHLSGLTYTSPAVGDIDRDGELEIVANGNKGLYALNSDGSSMAWTTPFNLTAIYASPVIADLDSDGTLEIIISAVKADIPDKDKLFGNQGKIYVVRSDGKSVSGWPVSTHSMVNSAVAVGDIDKDGDLEVAAGDSQGFFYIWHHNGTLVDGWPVHIGTLSFSTPILANVDEDDDSELLIVTNEHYDSALIYILNTNGKLIPSHFYGTNGAVFSTPALADLDNDGDSELALGTLRARGSQSSMYVLELKGKYDSEQIEWGNYQGNLANTGLYTHNIKLDVELSNFEATSTFKWIRLDWTTQTEIGIINWNIYRSDSLENGFEKLKLKKKIEGKLESHQPTKYHYLDGEVESGKIYYYYLEAVGLMNRKIQSDTIEAGIKFGTWASIKTEVGQNFPNPANPETWIPYQLAKDADVTLSIYDISGMLVRRIILGKQSAGIYTDKDKAIYWDGRNSLGEEVSSGIYFYHFQAGDYNTAERMVIIK